MPKYLEDNRRKLQGQQIRPTQYRPVQTTSAAREPVQSQTTTQTQAPVQAQTTATQPQSQTTTQTQVPTQSQTTTAPAQNAAPTAADQAQELLSQQPGAYESKWGSTIEDVLEQLLNPREFTYDPNTDPLYLQMRDQYARDGKLAMEDTMGIAAQLTGGYGNSHAQMLGQQTYQGYMREVNDMVPELRQQARAEYDAQNDLLLQQLGLLMDQDSQDYSRWQDEINRQYQQERDALADQRYDEEWAYQQAQDALANERYEEEWAYQQAQDALANEQYDQEWQYQQEQDAYARQQEAYDQLLELIIATGYTPTAEELAAAGMSEAEARAWRGYYTGNLTGGGSSGGGGGSGAYRTGGGDDEAKAAAKAAAVASRAATTGSVAAAAAVMGGEPSFTQKLADLKDAGASPAEIAELIDAMVADGIIDPGQAAGLKHIWAR